MVTLARTGPPACVVSGPPPITPETTRTMTTSSLSETRRFGVQV